ncbi:2643_t:CDS:2 [Dentiscutata heterogama]|uniref:2643_t:CDS:1 n=1 Tax=Dentiscutata heterogama TaxID=1316150 RepID=A0ACA9MV16_9GLOM|nr:2643_t:CDS:2 [Dentiscutata heterogama]
MPLESGELVKRLSLLEDQKNLIVNSANKLKGWLGTNDDTSSISDNEHEETVAEKLTPVNMVHAEDTLIERQSISTLEFRVHHLEKSIFGFDAISKRASVHEKLKEQQALLKRVDEIKKVFNTTIRDEADGLKSFLEIYDQVSDLVSPFKDSALAMERVVLTPEAKAEIVCSSEEELKLIADNLGQIKDLQEIIEAPEFKGFDKLFPQVTPIETSHIDQVARAEETSAHITSLLDKYNIFVNILSEIFISWDQILSTLDAHISALEREKE